MGPEAIQPIPQADIGDEPREAIQPIPQAGIGDEPRGGETVHAQSIQAGLKSGTRGGRAGEVPRDLSQNWLR